MGREDQAAGISQAPAVAVPAAADAAATTKPTRLTTRRVFLLVLAILFVCGLPYPAAGPIDDTYITFRYADNLVHGHGLVFNPGERVEGYTSFGELLLTAPAVAIAKPLARPWATLLALMGWAGVVALVWAYIDRRRGGGPLGRAEWFPIIFLATFPPAVVWAWSGMETALVALAWVASWFVHLNEREHERTPWRSGLLTFAAGLLHPEGALLVGLVLALSWLLPWRRRSLKNAAVYLGIAWGLFGLYWLWRWHYFGDFMPNTYWMKVGAKPPILAGLRYLFRSSSSTLIALYLFYLLWVNRRQWRNWPRALFVALGLWAAVASYTVLVGGDYFAFQRFMLPGFPLMVASIWMLQRFLPVPTEPKPTLMSPLGWAVTVSLLLALWCNFVPSLQVLEHLSFRRAIRPSVAAGKAFKAAVPRRDLVATLPIGAFGYYSGNRILDMMGLTDRHIAHLDIETGEGAAGHEKSDYVYVLSKRPEVIVQLPTLFTADQEGFQSWMRRSTFARQQTGIYEQPKFEADYRLAWLFVRKQRIRGRGMVEVGVYAFLRKDLVGRARYRQWRTFDETTSRFPFEHWREYQESSAEYFGSSLGMWNF